MIYIILTILFILLFIFLIFIIINYILKKMIDNILNKPEKFQNMNDDISVINPLDDCKKIDLITEKNLNFQTGTNIPLSPYYYKNYIGTIYMNDNIKNNNELKDGEYCLKKNKLLYDGIWDSDINKDSPYEFQNWELTNGNITNDYYCSNKLLEVNKKIPENYIDKSATPYIKGEKYYIYFNDEILDKYDTEIECFPEIFNNGIY